MGAATRLTDHVSNEATVLSYVAFLRRIHARVFCHFVLCSYVFSTVRSVNTTK